MENTINFNEQIGLDKMTIHGFRILKIDETKLLRNTNVTYEKSTNLAYQLSDGNSFSKIKIVDNKLFGALKAGTKTLARCKQDYATMDIFISCNETGNLQNYSHEEYASLLRKIYIYLQDRYGIEIDLYGIRIKKMEINCTFNLDHPYSEYRRVFQLLMDNLPKTYKTKMTCSSTNKTTENSETFYRYNDSIMWKVYDKTTQLRQSKNICIPYNTVRLELSLKTPKKIKEVFGTNLFFELNTQMIIQYYMQLFWEQIESKYNKWHHHNQKLIHTIILEAKETNPRKWQDIFLTACRNEEIINQVPVLLDISDALLQIQQLDTHSHYLRTKESLLAKCKTNDVFLQNDNEKMQELLYKINSIYEYMTPVTNINFTPTPLSGEAV